MRIVHWAGGRDAALDVTVTHPLQNLTRAGAAFTPGHAPAMAYDRKVRGALYPLSVLINTDSPISVSPS